MDVYKLYASAVTTTTAAAQLDIRNDGHIVALLLDLDCTADNALDDGAEVEVSFASTAGFIANDTSAVLASLSAHQGFLTTGGGPVGKAIALSGLAIAVGAGERMYLHLKVTGTSSVEARAFLYVMNEAGGGTRPARRQL